MNFKVTYVTCNFSVHIIALAYSIILKNNENLETFQLVVPVKKKDFV